MASAAQELKYLKGANLNIEMFVPEADKPGFQDADYAAQYDWWPVIRDAVDTIKRLKGQLTFPRGAYRVAYDGDDETRTTQTGVIDLSPWLDDETWVITSGIEIYFDEGAVLLMDNLMPNGYDAQTHGVFAQCRWTDSGGAHTPDTWSGYAVGYRDIRLVNVRVEWATRGSARGLGDAFHFAGTKSRATAPYGIVLDNCSAYNAPQVGAIAMGCQKATVRNFRAKDCWADTVHSNACFEGNIIDGVEAEDCGDDTVAVVTYYPDALTLAAGPDIDTEVGPFSSPDQETANNNGIIVSNVHKIGGRANGVRLQGANRAKVTGVSVDAHGSVDVGAALWVGSVKANGTTLGQSSLAAKGCEASKISAKGCNVGVHIVCLGMTGSEGDEWLRNDVLVRGISAAGSLQVSVWGQATKGFRVDGISSDSVKNDFSGCSDFRIDNLDSNGGELAITGETTAYSAADIDTMPWHNIELGSIRIRENRMLVTDVRGLLADSITIIESPRSSFEGIRLSDFICPRMRIIRSNRDAVSDLSHIGLRCIPGHRWKVNAEIDHDDENTQNLIEVGGGDAFNISRDVRIYATLIHEYAALGGDPWEIQGSTYAPVNFFRTSRCRNVGTWEYVNTDDLPLGIVPELNGPEVDGVKTVKVKDAIAVFTTSLLDVLQTTLGTAGVFGARVIRFLRYSGDQGASGTIDYGIDQSDALNVHGRGTSGSNRLIRLFDNVIVNGLLTAAGKVTGDSLRAAGLTSSKFVGTNGSGDLIDKPNVSLSSDISGILGISHGGTGSDDPVVVRNNFDLYSRGEADAAATTAVADYAYPKAYTDGQDSAYAAAEEAYTNAAIAAHIHTVSGVTAGSDSVDSGGGH